VVQPQKADIATTAATRTGTGEETQASTETALHETAFHHHRAEVVMPTETETAMGTALPATIAGAEVAAVTLGKIKIRAWEGHRARRL
jgi:hypothetical protein